MNFMDKETRTEIKDLMIDILATHTEKVDGKFNVIHEQLLAIKEQTTKTNGRLNKLEPLVNDNKIELDKKLNEVKINSIDHLLHCPQKSKIEELEKEALSRKTLNSFLIKIIGIISVLIGIVIGLMKLFEL